MSAPAIALQQSTIRNYAKQLRLPTLGGQFARLAEEAIKEKQSHVSYLEALLAAELEEREHNTVARRLQEAHLPKLKTLGVCRTFKFRNIDYT
jgi:DNA replication protein DnaC